MTQRPQFRFPASSVLFHGRQPRLDNLAPALLGAGVTLRSLDRLTDVGADQPAVVLVDAAPAAVTPEQLPAHVVVISVDDELSLSLLRASFELSAARLSAAKTQHDLTEVRADLAALNRTGIALMAERNHDALLHQILHAAIDLTTSDAGILFLMEEVNGSAQLRFKLVHSESVPVPDIEALSYTIDSSSMAGHVTITRQPLVVDDVHDLPADAPYRMNPTIVDLAGYWVKSILTVPMVDHRDEVVGVLQLANRKRDASVRLRCQQDCDQNVGSYSRHDTQIAISLAGQAAVCVENANLYRQIEQLFECFAKAAVIAIEQRDPTTAGHSLRVTSLVIDLAHALERSSAPSYRNLHFSDAQIRELRYAALLHDFGKVGVPEAVLVKARRLPPVVFERVHARFDLIRYALELEFEKKRARLRAENAPYHQILALAAELEQARQEVERCYLAMRAADDPAISMASHETLIEMAQRTFQLPDGRIERYLNDHELRYLQIPHGTLDENERREIEEHAQQTFEFLSQITWTDDLRNVPAYAAGHHEKLNGAGYPRRLRGDEIPVQMRLMAVADIFDALTAADRPYKRAVGADIALDIMAAEAKAGLLDPDVVDVLMDSQVYRRVLEEDWQNF